MSKFTPLTRARFFNGLVAVIMGCALNYFGDRLLGVKIELFRGILDFNGLWVIDMLVLPFFVGVLVAVIFGLGGKWLCYFPPLIVKLDDSYFCEQKNCASCCRLCTTQTLLIGYLCNLLCLVGNWDYLVCCESRVRSYGRNAHTRNLRIER
jgi:hypothetical protein